MAGALIAVLCLFVVRRLVFIVAALLPRRRFPKPKTQFSVLIAVAARDEELALPQLLRSLEELRYPSTLLSFVFVSDGSSDKTAIILNTWCAHRPRARFICADTSIGKAASLNLALTGAADEDLFVVYDADVVANRSSVARLAEAFGNPAVAAVSGCTLPFGKPSVPSACYAALEAWMHQFVNQSAIDRLDLSPRSTAATAHSGWRRSVRQADFRRHSARMSKRDSGSTRKVGNRDSAPKRLSRHPCRGLSPIFGASAGAGRQVCSNRRGVRPGWRIGL